MALTASRLVVIGGGRLLADTTVDELAARGGGSLEEGFFALTGSGPGNSGPGESWPGNFQRGDFQPGGWLLDERRK
jgi:ABC-2 type transport system ATP-binding protein